MEIKNHQVSGSGLTVRKSRLCITAQSWKLTGGGGGALSVAGGSADKAGGGGLRLSLAARF